MTQPDLEAARDILLDCRMRLSPGDGGTATRYDQRLMDRITTWIGEGDVPPESPPYETNTEPLRAPSEPPAIVPTPHAGTVRSGGSLGVPRGRLGQSGG